MTIEAAGGTVHWLDAPRGVRLRAAQWPGGGRGTVLLLNGRTEFIEKYAEIVAELQARGFAVWTLDWRGQGLSTRPLPDRHAHHAERFDDYLDDLDLLLDAHVLPGLHGQRLIMMAHSMGGHIGARMLARRPGLFAAAILFAPMIDFLRGVPLPRRVARLVIQLVGAWPGQAERYGPGMRRRPEIDRPFDGNKMTTCPDRYAAGLALVRTTPALGIGGVTWGWLRAAMASIDALLRPETMRRITMPVLVLLAGAERVVDNRAIRRFGRLLARGEVVEIAGARHELLREHDRYRLLVWEEIDRFLLNVIPGLDPGTSVPSQHADPH